MTTINPIKQVTDKNLPIFLQLFKMRLFNGILQVESEPLTLITINPIRQITELIFQEFCSYSKMTLLFSQTEELSCQELPIDHKRVSNPFGKHFCIKIAFMKTEGFGNCIVCI